MADRLRQAGRAAPAAGGPDGAPATSTARTIAFDNDELRKFKAYLIERVSASLDPTLLTYDEATRRDREQRLPISEVMVNGPDRVYVERKGKIKLSNVRFERASSN